MSIRLDKQFCAGVARLRSQLGGPELLLFSLLCSAGQLAYRLPDDNIHIRQAAGAKDPRKRLLREFSHRRDDDKGFRTEAWARASDRLLRLLIKRLAVREICEEDRQVRILLAYASIALAPDCLVPRDPVLRLAWDTAVKLFAKLFPSKVKLIGPLECVHRLLPRLKRETAAGLRIGREASGRKAGKEGRNLAVDPEFIALIGKALGKEMAPGYMAKHLFYTKPGDHIWPHPDDPKFAAIALICVRHEKVSSSSIASAFLAYRHNGSVTRYTIAPGSVLVVEPGAIHAREPVQQGEHIALLSIGLYRAPQKR